MRVSILSAVTAVFLMSFSAQAADECRVPMEPHVPDRIETKEQLMEVYNGVKDFNMVKSPEYIECLDVLIARVDPKADDAAAQIAAINQLNNDNVEAQAAVKARWDAAYGLWKEEHPE